MKPYLLALIIFSCTKETIEKPIEPISMTQTRIVSDQSNKYVETMLVIHFCKVYQPNIIAQYKALPAFQPFCDDWNDTLVTTIRKVCIEHKN